jgi:type I site-specific restriction endonuclease
MSETELVPLEASKDEIINDIIETKDEIVTKTDEIVTKTDEIVEHSSEKTLDALKHEIQSLREEVEAWKPNVLQKPTLNETLDEEMHTGEKSQEVETDIIEIPLPTQNQETKKHSSLMTRIMNFL